MKGGKLARSKLPLVDFPSTMKAPEIAPRRWYRHTIFGVLLVGTIAVFGWRLTQPSRAELEQIVFDAFAREDFARAEKALLRISPRDDDVLRLLADAALRTGRSRDCVRWLEQLAERSNRPADELLAAGVRAFDFGLPGEAERLYLKAAKFEPDSLRPYSSLARLYLALRRGTDLRPVLVQADQIGLPLEQDPMLLWLWVIGDRAEWLEDDAYDWLEQVHQNEPDNAYASAALARYWLDAGQAEEARKVLHGPLSTAEPRWPLLLTEAELAIVAKDWDKAVSRLKLVVGAGEHQAATWRLRGRVCQECEDWNGARIAFENAVRLDPWDVNARYERARLLAAAGDQRSQAELQRAAALDELVRRCQQLTQSAQPNLQDAEAAALLGASFDPRWSQLVLRMVERRAPDKLWPNEGLAIKNSQAGKLSLPDVKLLDLDFSRRQMALPLATDSHPTTEPPSSAVRFAEVTSELGLDFVYEYGHSPERWLMETLGGGVAVLDYDLDGWPDLYFCQGGPLLPSPKSSLPHGKLFRNEFGNRLSDITLAAEAKVVKYAHGCAVGDVNNDGFPDLLICHYGGLSLLMNRGDGSWSEEAAAANLANEEWNTSAAFVDLDRDGDVDLYVARYCDAAPSDGLRTCRSGTQFEPCRPNAYPAEADAVYENLGDGAFANRSREWGVSTEAGYGLGAIAADFDGDGDPEIFVGNDTTPNFLWKRQATSDRSLAMEDQGLLAGVAVDGSGRAEASMGIACGDVDGDERLDLFVTTFFDETCTLFENLGNLTFEDRTQQAGLSNAGRRLMGWGCQLFDADNDGWLDLAIVNGHLHDRAQLPQFFRNQAGRFLEQSVSAGEYFQQPKLGRSIATWDYDRDGRVDLVISHQTGPAGVLRNATPAGRSVTLRLVGTDGPRDATGTLVRIQIGERWLVRLVSSQGGYLSANSADLVIGLGDAEAIDKAEIVWPSGIRQGVHAIAAGTRSLIRENAGQVIPLP